MSTPRLSELEGRLLQAPEPGTFSSAELDGLAEPVRRHLTPSANPWNTAGHSARLRMRGHIKIGRWLPFRSMPAAQSTRTPSTHT
jgi:hypothetical protein